MQRDSVSNQLCEHAKAAMKRGDEKLTTSNGCPIDTLTASATAGPRGPIVLQVQYVLFIILPELIEVIPMKPGFYINRPPSFI